MFASFRPFKPVFKFSEKHFLSFLFIAFFLITLFLSVYLVQQPTKFEKRAAVTIDDPRLYLPTKIFIPFLPYGLATEIEPNEAPSQLDNSVRFTNSAPQSVSQSLKLYNLDGSSAYTSSISSVANGLFTFKPPACESDHSGCYYSMIIEASLSLSGVTNLLRSNGYQFSVSAYKAMNSSELKKDHFLPLIYRRKTNPQPWAGDRSSTVIALFNPSDESTTFSLKIYEMNSNQEMINLDGTLQPKETKNFGTLLTGPSQEDFVGYAHLGTSQSTALVVNLESEKRLFSYTSPQVSKNISLPLSSHSFLGPGIDSAREIYIYNTSNQEATINEYLYRLDGKEILATQHTIPPLSVKKGSNQATQIISDQLIAVVAIQDSDVYFGSAVSGQEGSDLVILPYLSYHYPLDTFKTRTKFYLYNPNDHEIEYKFTSHDHLGEYIQGESSSLASHQTKEISPFNETNNTEGSALIKASGKIVGFAEGMREINDSTGALLSGDALFTYEGDHLISTLPLPSPTSLCKTGVNSFSVYDQCDEGRFRYAKFVCYDGYSGTLGGPTSCKTSGTWREYAERECKGRSNCPTSTPSPTPAPTLPPSPSLIPTLPPSPTPSPPPLAQCNETCLSAGRQCEPGLECIQQSELLGSDKCRNPECPKEKDCVCPSPTPSPPSKLIIKTKGKLAFRVWPIMRVRVNGKYLRKRYRVSWSRYRKIEIDIPNLKPNDQVDIVFTNDFYYRRRWFRRWFHQDRNLYIDYVVIAGKRIEAESRRIIYDLGRGWRAFDGKKTRPGQEAMNWNGALRFNL